MGWSLLYPQSVNLTHCMLFYYSVLFIPLLKWYGRVGKHIGIRLFEVVLVHNRFCLRGQENMPYFVFLYPGEYGIQRTVSKKKKSQN